MTHEEISKLFQDFKAANDSRLQEIEDKGKADPLLEEKVEAINARLDEAIAESQASKKRVDDMELNLGRLSIGSGKEKTELENQAAEFFALTGNKGDVEVFKSYSRAFWNYLSKGPDAITPEFRNTLSVGADPSGGYFVLPGTQGAIVKFIYETSPMRQVAGVVSIGTDSLKGPKDLDEAGSGGWVGERTARAETATAEIGEWEIRVFEQYAQPKVTQQLLDDAVFPVKSWLSEKIADKLARVENAAFITGDRVTKPRGLLTYPAGKPSASGWGKIEQTKSGTANKLDKSDALIDMVYLLKNAYRQGAMWMMSRATLAEVRKMKDGQNNYLWQPGFTEERGGTLLGYPIVEAEDMPQVAANALSVAFGNFRQAYLIVDRMGIRVLRDPYTEKAFIKLYTTKRVGGGVVNFDAVKIMKIAA